MKIVTLATPCALVLFGCHSDVPAPPRPGETCFALTETDDRAKQSCEPEACFPQTLAVTDLSGTGAPFLCGISSDPCPKPNAQSLTATQNYTYRSGNQQVQLYFDNTLLVDGYSLENFKKYARGATVWVQYDLTYDTFTGAGTPEFVAYDQGVLHVRFSGDDGATYMSALTAPYSCSTSSEISLPSICTTTRCDYSDTANGGAGDPVHLTVDLNVPIVQVAP